MQNKFKYGVLYSNIAMNGEPYVFTMHVEQKEAQNKFENEKCRKLKGRTMWK